MYCYFTFSTFSTFSTLYFTLHLALALREQFILRYIQLHTRTLLSLAHKLSVFNASRLGKDVPTVIHSSWEDEAAK